MRVVQKIHQKQLAASSATRSDGADTTSAQDFQKGKARLSLSLQGHGNNFSVVRSGLGLIAHQFYAAGWRRQHDSTVAFQKTSTVAQWKYGYYRFWVAPNQALRHKRLEPTLSSTTFGGNEKENQGRDKLGTPLYSVHKKGKCHSYARAQDRCCEYLSMAHAVSILAPS